MCDIGRHPQVAATTFDQGLLGGVSVKPTTMMHLRLPTFPDRIKASEASPAAPLVTLTGQNEGGVYRTNQANEYPDRLNFAIAASIHDQFRQFRSCKSTDNRCRQLHPIVLSKLKQMYVPFDPYLDMQLGADYAEFNILRPAR